MKGAVQMTEKVKKVLDEFIEDIGKAEDDLELYSAEDRAYGAIEFAFRTGDLTDKNYDEYSVMVADAVFKAEKEIAKPAAKGEET